MDLLQKYWLQWRAFWNGLSAPHRFLAIAVGAAILLTGAAVSFVSLNVEYVPVAPSMAPEEVAGMVAHLETANIPHRLDPAGTTVLVPKDRLARARVELAGKGFSTRGGGKGLELMDDMSMGVTPFVQNVNYTRALQGELARSIMQLEPIASARVHIARGEPTPFVRERQPTTASVVLKLKPGAGINRSTAAGIVALVARSVEGLEPQNVTVIDAAGRVLSEARGADGEGLSSEQLEYRQKVESYLGQKAEEMLVRGLGLGRAFVRVSVDMNHQKMREVSIKYSPEERAAKRESLVSTKSGAAADPRSAGGAAGTANPSDDPRGVAGAASNTGRNFVVATGATRGGEQEDKNETEYLVPETRREVESHMHAVDRITVAVMADLTPREGEKTPSIADVEAMVKQAVGYKAGRDEIKVSDVTLSGDVLPPEPKEATWVEQAQGYVHLARNVAVLVAFGLLLTTVLVLARRLVVATRPKPAPALAAPPLSPDRQRFLDMARAEPQQTARVLASLLHGMN